ncbi:hypothetical protein JNB88_27560 [Rhizobium cauense]|uniref:hypothetical protein n=1 Tax=Rhizobium cauense TaxID=1166683 RepID=UPI001C6E2E45|nr:hypothetical protein [Rhizobium cauense]MBW9117382.1 hypothetical protein [Rhizobium cauense]
MMPDRGICIQFCRNTRISTTGRFGKDLWCTRMVRSVARTTRSELTSPAGEVDIREKEGVIAGIVGKAGATVKTGDFKPAACAATRWPQRRYPECGHKVIAEAAQSTMQYIVGQRVCSREKKSIQRLVHR